MADSIEHDETTSEDNESTFVNFHQMGLDDRLQKAIAKLCWKEPTLIQEKAIPLILEGKDLLARARTGSGKTAAFALPLIQKILHDKQFAREQVVYGLVMAPSKELCHQLHANFKELTISCSRDIRCVDISAQVNASVQRPLLLDLPDIVIGTPSRVLLHMKANNLTLKESLKMLVIDEADLIFSFGFEEDLKEVLVGLPEVYQAVLTSATLSDDVNSLKSLVLHNPVILKLEEPQLPTESQLAQYVLKVEEEDKFVLIFALFKLRLVRGKTIIFVNNVDRCYKLKLYLEQFGIPTCILNSELPINARWHIVTQFNQGVYDIIVASDEQALQSVAQGLKIGVKKRHKKDKESGASRGIDFQFVSNVINFDFPLDVDSYIHRVGRTSRGNNQGSALSFVNMKEIPLMEAVEKHLSGIAEGACSIFKPYNFRMEEMEGFRYRAKDAWRAVTRIAVREARLAEIKKEIFNSNKLKSYFEDNPRELQLLRHDKSLQMVRVQPHLKDIPDYIVPHMLRRNKSSKKRKYHDGEMGNDLQDAEATIFYESQKSKKSPKMHHDPMQKKRKVGKSQEKYNKRQANPLKSMKFSGFKKKNSQKRK